MVLELHIWGPAFSLPSIDPCCLATVIYLRLIVPSSEWVLIASSDDSISPTKALPALRDGQAWIGGFRNIIDHLSRRSGCQWDLDSANCSSSQIADITAFSAFVESNGQAILDLSHFVSSENYLSTTRPAYSRLLHWPDQWFILPRKRSMAKTRTDHLGLSSLDLDTANEEQKKHTSTPSGTSVMPQSLRPLRQTIIGLAKQPEYAARFRLDALADAFLKPLQQLLDEKRYMLSEEHPSSLDCVVYAYLALTYTPQMPHAWVAYAMRSRYPELCEYVDRVSTEFFDGPVDVSQAIQVSEDDQAKAESSPHARISRTLPWRKPEPEAFSAVGSKFLSGTINSLPLAEHFQKSNVLVENEDAEARGPRTTHNRSNEPSHITPHLLAAFSTIAAVGAYLFYSGIFSEPSPQRSNLSDMGEAGAMLDMAAFGGYSNPTVQERQRPGRIPVGLEVDVEVDDSRAQ